MERFRKRKRMGKNNQKRCDNGWIGPLKPWKVLWEGNKGWNWKIVCTWISNSNCSLTCNSTSTRSFDDIVALPLWYRAWKEMITSTSRRSPVWISDSYLPRFTFFIPREAKPMKKIQTGNIIEGENALIVHSERLSNFALQRFGTSYIWRWI